MNHAISNGEDAVRADDAEFDAWLESVDDGVLDRIDTALDLDAGRAAIFAGTVTPESVPADTDGDETEPAFAKSLSGLLHHKTAHIEQWLARSAPNHLPYQLDQAASTTRTMIVVGRALLSHDMPAPWGLASDFLHTCLSDLLHLKTGLAQRDLEREAALALHAHVLEQIESFCGVLDQCIHDDHGPRALQISERLITAAQTVQTLLGWTRKGIEHLFNDTGQTRHLPLR